MNPPTRIACSTRPALALFVSLLVGCATGHTPTTGTALRPQGESFGSQAECRPRFPDQAGWLGADAAYSVTLPSGDGRRSLWLFGDTFVARPGARDERSYPLIHNSIALSHCSPDGGWRLDPFWGRDEAGNARAFFEPHPEADWVRRVDSESGGTPYYWPLDGFVFDGALYVSLLRVAPSAPRGPFNLPFRLVGVDLARIANYRETPPSWHIELATLSDEADVFPGAAFVETPSHLYAFAFLDDQDGGSPRILTRLSWESVSAFRTDLSVSMQMLADDGRWSRGLDAARSAILMDDDATEMSVHFDPERQAWVAVYSALEPWDGSTQPLSILTRSAKDLNGPWSEPVDLAPIPETQAGHPWSLAENLFCYAGKAHPQFSTSTRLIVTYACNLYAREPSDAYEVLERLRTSPDLYRPKSLIVRDPSTKPGRANRNRDIDRPPERR